MQRERCNSKADTTGVARDGLTLIELLIAMTILVLLVGVAIPVLSPSSSDRRIREASRGINTHIAGAQARATQTGRPVGVMFKKFSQETGDPDDNAVCLELYYVEQPKPYAGFTEKSRVRIAMNPDYNPSGDTNQTGSDDIAPFFIEFVTRNGNGQIIADLLPPDVFRPGDQVEVGGSRFTLLGVTGLPTVQSPQANGYFAGSDGTVLLRLPATPSRGTGQNNRYLSGATLVTLTSSLMNYVYDADGDRLTDLQPAASPDALPPYWTEMLPYKIYRLPALTSAPPYQLPEGTAIDLRGSGTGEFFFHQVDRDEADASNFSINADLTGNASPVIVMFSPDGSISDVYTFLDENLNNDQNEADVLASVAVTSNIYLLVGKRESIPAPLTNFNGFAGTESELEEAKAEINWLDGESRWVTIGGQSGVISTSQNGFVNPATVANQNASETSTQIRNREITLARELAFQKVKEGGQ